MKRATLSDDDTSAFVDDGLGKTEGWQRHLVRGVAIAMSLFQLVTVDYRFMTQHGKYIVHVAFVMVLLLLSRGIWWKQHGKRAGSKLDLALAVVVTGISVYAFVNFYSVFASAGAEQPTYLLVMSAVMLVLALALSVRVVGWAMAIVVIVAILYARFSDYAPGFLQQRGISWDRLLERLFLTSEGFYGSITGVSATFVFMFVLFGAFLIESGATGYYSRLAMAFFGALRGGAAKVAIASSALFAMISGSAIANAASTGQFTIPMMRKAGYRREFSAGVESVSSMGGEVTPPVMAGSVFIMVALTGIGYSDIALAAVLVSIALYATMFLSVDVEAKRRKLVGMPREELPRRRESFGDGWYYFVPLVLLLVLVLSDYPPERAALFGVLSVPISVALTKNRMSVRSMLRALEKGAYMGAAIGSMVILASVVTAVINYTGIGLIFANNLLDLAGDSLTLLLILSFLACVLLGLGLPATTCYVIGAVMVAPAMIQMGSSVLAAHLFVLYGAMFSQISPPVATTVVVTSEIAGAGLWRSCWEAIRLAISKIVLPFMLVYHPALTLYGDFTFDEVALAVARSGIVVIAAVFALQGFGNETRLEWVNRILIGAGAVALMGPGDDIRDLAGLILVAVPTVIEVVASRRQARTRRLSPATAATTTTEGS
ncbi:TRAP transporter permease [Actinophytocola sp.]|uniref:TRAP transporter permease n=1 Tax=Actinophytocola sp. TaxID=1872138 RepID=UPI003D6B63E4